MKIVMTIVWIVFAGFVLGELIQEKPDPLAIAHAFIAASLATVLIIMIKGMIKGWKNGA